MTQAALDPIDGVCTNGDSPACRVLITGQAPAQTVVRAWIKPDDSPDYWPQIPSIAATDGRFALTAWIGSDISPAVQGQGATVLVTSGDATATGAPVLDPDQIQGDIVAIHHIVIER